MKQLFNKYFIGLIFVLCIVFIPNHKVQADVSASCLGWSTYSEYTPGRCNEFGCDPDTLVGTWTYCTSWNPLVVSITLNGNQFDRGATITADANVYFVDTTNSANTEVELKATVNGITKTLMSNIFSNVIGGGMSTYTSDGGKNNIAYKYLHGVANFTAPSSAGNYNLTYTATAKKVTYATDCSSSYWEYQCPLGWGFLCDIAPFGIDSWEYVQICTGRSSTPTYGTPTIKSIGPATVGYKVLSSLTVNASTIPKNMVVGGKVNLKWDSSGANSCYCYSSPGGGNCFTGYYGNTKAGQIYNIPITSAITFNIICQSRTSQLTNNYYKLSMDGGGPHPWDNNGAGSDVYIIPKNVSGTTISALTSNRFQADELGYMDGSDQDNDLNWLAQQYGLDHFVDAATGTIIEFTYVP